MQNGSSIVELPKTPNVYIHLGNRDTENLGEEKASYERQFMQLGINEIYNLMAYFSKLINIQLFFISNIKHQQYFGLIGRKYEIDYILLAGYLKLLPLELVQAYPRAILNIHPALLPAFGGKGYYGRKVHEAVIKSGAR